VAFVLDVLLPENLRKNLKLMMVLQFNAFKAMTPFKIPKYHLRSIEASNYGYHFCILKKLEISNFKSLFTNFRTLNIFVLLETFKLVIFDT